jgi:hypothetical protein
VVAVARRLAWGVVRRCVAGPSCTFTHSGSVHACVGCRVRIAERKPGEDRSSDLTGEASQPSTHHLGAADRVAVVRTSRIGGVRLVIVLAVIALCRR